MLQEISKSQFNDIVSYVMSLENKNFQNYLLGKCGEVAFHNFINTYDLFDNFYRDDLNEPILKPLNHADDGYDCKIISKVSNRVFNVQIKTTTSNPKNKNIILNKKLYNSKLDYYTKIPQDIFIFIKHISGLTYDINNYYNLSLSYLDKDNFEKLKSENQLSIRNTIYLLSDINDMHDKRILNVVSATEDSDAINYNQLIDFKSKIDVLENNITSWIDKIQKLSVDI